jgi:hemerythrin-like domain-containing protein
MEISKTEHIISLAKEILDDIELSRLEAQPLLLKATRLARYVDDEEVRKWLRFEMQGFSNDEVSLKYMTKTGRWTDREKNEGYWTPLAQIEASADAQKQKLSLIRIPDTSGDKAIYVIDRVTNQMNAATQNIAKLEGIKSRVISFIHDFATNVYYQRTFDNVAEGIFDKYKKDIDILIAENSGDVLEQIPSVVGRLSDGDKESVSQALTTCRRIIDSFANHIFPATDETLKIGDNVLSLKQDKVLNRINAFIHTNSESESRKKKLRQNLSNLYDRVSAGVHSDVDANEARSLFFNTYLLLGEILTLKK